ncbi:TetR/AcrR family transcriptional regulator [Streptomyces sp. SID13666]|uniref:TetR family transcriptional regulator n=1 Tax=unclassified Streptomyces TaxID=2593676 RepID=UPI0013C25799|nr:MULTISPECIES: TetR family transcriptional regulator [unclassified Streptomyces]NEA55472.1 TetR/AcrR family transcriptional regulator [Streptomyces sp. SID13666]NEA71674.1 TetR/AcrR family transcriptional regulator [Streptomyces sp. SID13588]
MPPPPRTLTTDRILEATEDVLRRYGPAKATVVDVARALGVSHGTVYRHFASKAALREAVTQRWLDQSHATLAAITTAPHPAPERLRQWLTELFAAKRRKAGGDPELFATYLALASEASAVVAQHVEDLVGQLSTIVSGGLAHGEFFLPESTDPSTIARAIWDATGRFHDPVYAAEWSQPGIDTAFDAVCDLLLNGLRPQDAPGTSGTPPT